MAASISRSRVAEAMRINSGQVGVPAGLRHPPGDSHRLVTDEK
jgi:hypothetical protein